MYALTEASRDYVREVPGHPATIGLPNGFSEVQRWDGERLPNANYRGGNNPLSGGMCCETPS